ncbi:MAG: hypothetical protein IH598_12820, partial [Bacteroidales bacterium]|nr:hypothetical protein [Bacteroidales bacterium]
MKTFNQISLACLMLLINMVTVNAQTTKTVGTIGADYATLKLAFDDINAGNLSGAIV